jgi:hypothetical protein
MQEAVAADQSVDDGEGRRYIDNDDLNNEKADDDAKSAIISANTEEDDTSQDQGQLIKEESGSGNKASQRTTGQQRMDPA